MVSICRCLAVIAMLVAAPAYADDKQKADRKEIARPQQDLTPLLAAGEVTGRIARINSGSSFTLEVVQAIPQLRGQPAVRRAGGIRPPTLRIENIRRQFVLEVSDDVAVRVLQLPLQFDEMGQPRKYTAEEIRQMRGVNHRLPGYKSDYDSLKAGQIVRVSFRPVQAPARSADKGEDKDAKKKADNTPRVRMIVVLSDSDSATAGRKDDPKDPKKK